MSLTTEIASTTRVLALRVRIANILISASDPNNEVGIPGILSVRVSKSLDSPVPVATITVNRIPIWIKRGYPVTIDAGYNGLYRRIFTGYVINRSKGTEAGDIECAGQMYQLSRINDLTERDVTGDNVKDAISGLFTAAGGTTAFVGGINVVGVPTTFTLGSVVTPMVLPPGSFMGMLQALMDIEGAVIYETGDGALYVRVLNGLPAATAFKSFTTDTLATARIIDGRSQEDPDYLRTRIHATGATPLVGGPPLTVTATLVGADLVQPPFVVAATYIDMEWSNSLIDTQAKLNTRALEVLSQYARVPRQLPLEIPGDPEIEVAQTVYVKDEYIDSDANWFVHGIEHIIDGSGYVTNLDLRGGDEFGGEINVNPVATFTYSVEREVFGTQVYALITLDASASYDPDGTIASYAWAGNQDAADDPAIDSQTAAIFTVRIDPTAMAGDPDIIEVTLTVTDNDGLTASIMQEIDINASSSLTQIPAVFAALDNNFSATPDGGQNWNDDTTNATNVTTVAAMPPDGVHSGIAVYGRTDGKIYRTTDYCASDLTLVLTATDNIVDIAWDIFNPQRVWALTAICNLYVSSDMGVTWTLIVNWRTQMALSTIIGKRVAVQNDGAVWVYGGTGVTNNGRPFIGRFVNGQTPFGFASVFGGELQTDLGSGTTALAIVDAANKHDGGGLTIILENYTAFDSGVRPIYHCSDPFVEESWERATGLDSGVTLAGRYVVPDDLPGEFHAAFADRDIWHTTNGVAWTVSANVMPVVTTDVIPNRCIWLREDAEGLRTSGTYLIAAQNTGATVGIYKSYDGLQTVDLFRPATGFATWPASALAKDLAIGPAQQAGSQTTVIIAGELATPTEMFIAWRKGAGNFTAHIFPANLDTTDFFKLRTISATIWFGFFSTAENSLGNGVAVRTKDGGTTWDDLYAAADTGRAWQDIVRAADGRYWGLTVEAAANAHVEIYYNDDAEADGAWTESKDDVAVDGSRFFHVLAHPTNPNIIIALAYSGGTGKQFATWYTTDRGATWTKATSADLRNGPTAHRQGAMLLGNTGIPRIVTVGWADSTNLATIWTSDDWGASWVARKTFANVISTSAEHIYGPVGDKAGNRLFVMVENKTATPDDNEIWESTDFGVTWRQDAGDALSNGPPRPAATDVYLGGLAYDSQEGALYLYGAGENNSNNVSLVAKTVGLGWQDVSDALIASLTGHTNFRVTNETTHGIAVIH
ncbi:MAG TPA: hypothetical protein VJB57_19420 [Dehalococcoidia bacterium]|nr:hypothetical protein [Dehalococcoidia bacterium]